MKVIKIKNCKECPYLFGEHVIYCNKKKDWIRDENYSNRIPDDCPLEEFKD
jgi:hypothetical protein